jgi:hypothetical protein
MADKRWRLSRRTFLRGAGAAIALPWLESISPVGRALASSIAPTPPTRMACLFFPNGVWQEAWIPEKTGDDFELPFSLEPLKDLKSEVLVLSGLDKANSHDGDGHYAKTANFLTGTHITKTTGKDINSGGISIDQLAAKKLGHLTPLASLELGTEPVISGIDSAVGYTRLYGSYISWETPTRPLAKEINPRMVYERMFGQRKSGSNNNAEQDDFHNLLDSALDDAHRLRKRLGRDDQFKLDEYLDAVRSVERRIEFHSKEDPREWQATSGWEKQPSPTGIPRDFAEHIRLMLDMIVLAFWSDSTRISTFMFANDVSSRNFSFVDGVRGAHHEMSHHENKAEKIEQYKRINRWHTEQFAYVLNKMRNIKEGTGTLLDNSMVLFGCGFSDGNKHDPKDLPILLGGRAGGSITPGRHIATPKGTPLCNLYVSMLERMGCPVEKFGDSTEPLWEISQG